jgi:hypothetical protein
MEALYGQTTFEPERGRGPTLRIFDVVLEP